MPNLKVHSESSKIRTGKTYEDLHKWMDVSQKFLNENHRLERHSNIYIEYVKEKWGTEGVKEFLHHIIEDYEHTLKMYDTKCVYCGKATWKGNKLCNECSSKMNRK